MKIASDNRPTSAFVDPRRGGFETRPWPPALALTRPALYRSSVGLDTTFITLRGPNKAIVITSLTPPEQSGN